MAAILDDVHCLGFFKYSCSLLICFVRREETLHMKEMTKKSDRDLKLLSRCSSVHRSSGMLRHRPLKMAPIGFPRNVGNQISTRFDIDTGVIFSVDVANVS